MIRRLLALAAAFPVIAAAQAAPQQPAPPPEVFIRSPADGATVPATFTVVFGLRNYGVAPAGVTGVPNAGHFHLIVDVAPPAVGQIIPKDSVNIHFGGGQIETKVTLKPGKHTLRAVLGDFEHRVTQKEFISKPITVIVK
ncbi:MAG TPA: DUF4399 domain-containing protein [Gemmatimonadaceae bacterium]|nr:DUF4399 domain-containing protein [Gemmatimonadaceae bacterium]